MSRPMTELEKLEMNEIFGIENSLGEIGSTEVVKFSCTLELTLNYPRTAPFKRMDSVRQDMLYDLMFHNIVKHYPSTLKYSKRTFESCKDGNRHLHGYLCFEFPHLIYPKGLVSDVVRLYLAQLPKRYRQFADCNFWDSIVRYRCPSIVCQYREVSDIQRLMDWDKYIDKCVQK